MFTLTSKSIIVFSLNFLCSSFICLVSATPNTKWISIFDGGNDDEAYCVVESYDGGFALAGITNSFDHSNYDFWLVKTNAIGEEQWNMTYGVLQTRMKYWQDVKPFQILANLLKTGWGYNTIMAVKKTLM